MYSHKTLAIDLKYAIRYNRELCSYDETRGEMIEISALPGSVTKVIHLHYNDWPLPVTFCQDVNKLFCLSLFQTVSSDQPTLFLVILLNSNGFPSEALEVFVTLHQHF